MSKTRRQKALAVEVPETVEAFRDLCADQARDLAEIAALEAERELRLAEVNKDIEERLARRTPTVAGRFASIKAWWEGNGQTIAGAKRSAVVASLNIGHRVTPPSLKLPSGEQPVDLIRWFKSFRDKGVMSRSFTRIKTELNREAIISSLKQPTTPQAAHLLTKGFALSQKDEFFIEPVNPAEPTEEASA